ncbi:MAG TPA: GAF domain-containing protein, partial [Stenomitos sp.]
MLTDAREQVWMQVNEQICQSVEIDTIFSNAALAIRHILNTDQVAILQFEPILDGLQGTFVAEDVALEVESFVALETCDRNNIDLQNLKHCLTAYYVNGLNTSKPESDLLSIPDTLKAEYNPNLCAILLRFKIRAGLMIPLKQQGKTRGLLCIYQCGSSRQWQSDEILFATQVALQLGLALQQNALRQQVQWQSETIETQSQQMEWVSRQERALAYINTCIQQVLDIEQIFATVTLTVQQLLQVDRVAIYRFAPQDSSGQGQFIAENVVPECDTLLSMQAQPCSAQGNQGNDSVSLSFYGGHYINVAQQSPFISIADTALDCLNPEQWQLLNELQVKAELVLPLKQGEHLWGLLCLHQCCRPREWQPAEVEYISRIAIQLSVAIQQTALHSQVQAQAPELKETFPVLQSQQEQTAYAIDPFRAEASLLRQLSQMFPSDSVFSDVLQEVRHLLGCDRLVMYRFSPDWSGEFLYESVAAHLTPWVNLETTATWRDTCLQDHQGGHFQALESVVVDDVYQMHYQPCHRAQLESRHIRAFIVVPIVKGEKLWGLLGAYSNATPKQWNRWQVYLLEIIGVQLGQLLQKVTLVQQLQQAQDAATVAYRSKSIFLAKMSHELRTPLNAVLGFSQMLRKDPTLNPSQRETLNTIYQGGADLLDLVNNLLALSTLEAGKSLHHPLKEFNLCAFLNTLYDSFLPRANAKGLALSFVYDVGAHQHIQADEENLRQVLVNLLSNAIKFTDAGQVCLHVRLQQSNPQTSIAPASTIDCLFFAIEDTGIGFTDTQLETVRDPLSSLSQDTGTTAGVGLGLTLSRNFIQSMGGEISIESEVGRGTIVRFHIPVQFIDSVGQTQRSGRRVLGLVADQP